MTTIVIIQAGLRFQGAVVSMSVGCRVSRVATLPSTPDTDTVRLKMYVPEGKNVCAGGFECMCRRVRMYVPEGSNVRPGGV